MATEKLPTVRPLEAQIINPPVPPSEMSDADLGREAAIAVDRAVTLRENSAEQARRAGELLLEAKHRCRESGTSFRHWLQKFWPKSRATAEAYILIATEVQSSLAGAPGQEPKDLLAHQSIRKFLTDRGYGAGGTRGGEPEDDEDREATERAIIDRATAPDPTLERKPRHTPASAPARGGLSSPLTPEEQARRAEAAARIKAERAAIDEARDRPPLVQQPPANPHQVGHPKKPPPPPEFPTSLAEPLREVVALLADARRRLLLMSLGAPTPSTTKQLGEAQQVFAPLVARWEQVLSQVADEDAESVEFMVDRIKAERKRGA